MVAEYDRLASMKRDERGIRRALSGADRVPGAL